MNQKIDKTPIDIRAQTSKSKSLNSMMVELGLVDIWRLKHPKERDYTHFSGVHKSYSRRDFFCISKQDAYKAVESHIEPAAVSDHGPVILSLRLSQENPTKHWRLNVSLLNNLEIVQNIKDELENFLEHNDNGEVSVSTLWDTAKAVLRGKIIALSSKLKKEREKIQFELEESIKNLEQQHKRTKDDSILKALNQNKQKLNELLTHKAEGALRFSNQKYYEPGNRASRLLAFQLRKAKASRVVQRIVCPSSKKQMSHPKDIVETFAAYYKKLYDSPETENNVETIRNFLDPLKSTKLDENDAKAMAEPITENEIKEVIKNLKNNKSLGTNGYPGEFYKCLQAEITPLLQGVFNYASNKTDPPKTWSEAIISVIYKEGKDPTECASYRPISLLCNDAKILSSIMAKRIQKHINKIIKPDQTGFIPGRLVSNNIRRTLNIVSTAKTRNQSSMLLSIDAEKAFDRVNWRYLEHTLIKMGFHLDFISWIKILYMRPNSRVRVNGHTSEQFELKRGTRQGCPLSPLLFSINIEPLAEMIRENPLIHGISSGGGTHKISMYADDIILYINDPLISIPTLLKCLRDFGSVSGYKINESKSEAMMLVGKWPSELEKIVSFRRLTSGFRYLGVMITPDTSQLYNANYGKLITQIRADLERWKILPLSLFGRTETIKMNILPRLLYLFQSLSVWISSSAFKMLDRLISTFIWQKRKPRIKLKQLTWPKRLGGS